MKPDLAPEELDALLDLALRGREGAAPWLGGTAQAPQYLFLVPQWDGSFARERAAVAAGQRSLGQALREHAARHGAQPTFDLAWATLTGKAPWRFPLPIEPQMDALKERCDGGDLIVGAARSGAPRLFRFAAFDEVYEVTLELPGGERVVCPWRDWAGSLELLCSLPRA